MSIPDEQQARSVRTVGDIIERIRRLKDVATRRPVIRPRPIGGRPKRGDQG